MSRVAQAILGENAFARLGAGAMLDLSYGGQHGYSPVLTEWVSNQAYVQQHLCCMVLEAPRFFQLMPEPSKWVQTLKSIFEQHVKTIGGFNAGLTVEFDEHPVGGAGEMQQELTDVKRARTEPTFEVTEKFGRPIQTFIEQWIIYGLMDPESKFAMVGTLAGTKPDDLLADWFTASMLFYEPDPTNQRVMKAWITTNMMPKGTGDITGKRDLTVAKELSNISIEMTGISQYGVGPRAFAQRLLDGINRANANPSLRPAFIDKIASDVEAANISGYAKGITDLGTQAIVKL